MSPKKYNTLEEIENEIEELNKQKGELLKKARELDAECFDAAALVLGSQIINLIGDWKTIDWESLEVFILSNISEYPLSITHDPQTVFDAKKKLDTWSKSRRKRGKHGFFFDNSLVKPSADNVVDSSQSTTISSPSVSLPDARFVQND